VHKCEYGRRIGPRHVVRIAAAAGAAVLLAACSTASSSSSSSPAASSSAGVSAAAVNQAKAELQQYSGSVALTGPGPSFDAAKAKGKTVMLAAYDASNPALAEADGTFLSAMTKAGVKVILCNGNSTPTGDNACMSEAFAQKMAAIEAQGSKPSTYSAQIGRAESLHIPVFEGADADPTSTPLYQGLAANAGPPWRLVGKLMAEWIVANSGGDAHILYLTIPDVDGALQEESQFKSTLGQLCPSCTMEVKGVVVADWASDVAPATSAALLADRSINFVVPGFDPMVDFAGPAIQQLGRQNSVKIVTSGSTFTQMQQLSRDQLIYADVGIDYPALGMLEADQVLRAITASTQEKALAPPVKVFTRTNIGSVTVSEADATSGAFFTSPAAYEATFFKAWGLPTGA
jgi:ribose transport system substrate-binding protein